jgi:hypothetical protein
VFLLKKERRVEAMRLEDGEGTHAEASEVEEVGQVGRCSDGGFSEATMEGTIYYNLKIISLRIS